MSGDTVSDPIGTIAKSRAEEVRVAISEFHGFAMIDVRVFAAYDDGFVGPTKKGVSLKIERLPELIGLLSRAAERARDRGLLPFEVDAA